MREYYIRREGDEDSSGPYDLDQISSLMEAGKLDAEAFYYDIESEQWSTISSNQEMMDTLFPKKRKLSLRLDDGKKETPPALPNEGQAAKEGSPDADSPSDADADYEPPEGTLKTVPEPKLKKQPEPEKKQSITVQAMLAQAEGRDEESGGMSPRERKSAAAFIALRALTLFFLASAFVMAVIERDVLLSANALEIVRSPYLVIAIFDVVMVLFLLLQVTTVYPLLRFRAALGLGLLSIFFYASGDPLLVASNALLMVAIYFSTVVIKMKLVVAITVVGLLGLAGYALALFPQFL